MLSESFHNIFKLKVVEHAEGNLHSRRRRRRRRRRKFVSKKFVIVWD
jgi:hypothetical protein